MNADLKLLKERVTGLNLAKLNMLKEELIKREILFRINKLNLRMKKDKWMKKLIL